jgi:hypothetical protein
MTPTEPFACRNCRRPLYWSEATGWLHGELPQYAHEPITCENPVPVCSPRSFTKADPSCEARLIASGPHADCACGCHAPAPERTAR